MPGDVLSAHLLCFSIAAFLRVTKMRLSVLLKKQEENYIYNVKDWVVREASNQDALQEAGTFRYCREGKPGLAGGWMHGSSSRGDASFQTSEKFRAVNIFSPEHKMVWVAVTWGLPDSFLYFCVSLNFFITQNKTKQPRTFVLVGCKLVPACPLP